MIRKVEARRDSCRFVAANGMAYFNGHISPFAEDLRGQSKDVLNRFDELLAKYNLKKENIVYFNAYLKDMAHSDEFLDEWNRWVLKNHEPAGVMLQACPDASLPYGEHVLIELSLMVAMEETYGKN